MPPMTIIAVRNCGRSLGRWSLPGVARGCGRRHVGWTNWSAKGRLFNNKRPILESDAAGRAVDVHLRSIYSSCHNATPSSPARRSSRFIDSGLLDSLWLDAC